MTSLLQYFQESTTIAFYQIISFKEFSFTLTPPVTLDMFVSSICYVFLFFFVTSIPARLLIPSPSVVLPQWNTDLGKPLAAGLGNGDRRLCSVSSNRLLCFLGTLVLICRAWCMIMMLQCLLFIFMSYYAKCMHF
uniref:ATP synthase F0 subunit 6 n=1 Tax=Pyxicephalus adspersus TaxID=30357 RepID=A0AAV3A513_PYXAD|nr:TPA: hypothetical protein GDO54_015309 [Pyxicephalus adspersus]